MNLKSYIIPVTIASLGLFSAEAAAAAGGVAGATAGWSDQLNGILKFAVILLGFIGFIVFATAVMKVYKHFKSPQGGQDDLGGAIISMIIGIVLMSITTFATMGSQSVAGADAVMTMDGQAVQGGFGK